MVRRILAGLLVTAGLFWISPAILIAFVSPSHTDEVAAGMSLVFSGLVFVFPGLVLIALGALVWPKRRA